MIQGGCKKLASVGSVMAWMLEGSAHRYVAHGHEPIKGVSEVAANTEKGHGFFP
jgi:hypothetical protein